jgi:hypothetical protein
VNAPVFTDEAKLWNCTICQRLFIGREPHPHFDKRPDALPNIFLGYAVSEPLLVELVRAAYWQRVRIPLRDLPALLGDLGSTGEPLDLESPGPDRDRDRIRLLQGMEERMTTDALVKCEGCSSQAEGTILCRKCGKSLCAECYDRRKTDARCRVCSPEIVRESKA